MRNTFKVLFYIKRSAPLRSGEVPIMGRITINGQRAQFSTQLAIAQELWDVASGRAMGRGGNVVVINEKLSRIRFRIEKCYSTLFYEQSFISPQLVKAMYFGIDNQQESLLGFFRLHNEEFQQMVGVSRSAATYYKYRCVYRHLERYVIQKYARGDLNFKELTKDFLLGFHAYISQECKHKKNTTWIYMIAFKHILMLARSRGYLKQDLFANYKLHSEFVSRNYLSINEINSIIALPIDDPTLQLVRDAFLFSCFTGFSYIDLLNLTPANIVREKKQIWISTTRRKTGSEVNVRLFSVPLAILLRYQQAKPEQRIFELPSNGWCNICLDKLRMAAGIEKRITFHCARHTFATTITLSQGVAIETISKLLGHKNIRTTQIYAVITRSRLDGEMESLSKKIDLIYNKSTPEIG